MIMSNLPIPPIKQVNPYTCGAAVFEMIYIYFGITNFSQEAFFNKFKRVHPYDSTKYVLSSTDLEKDAENRGLKTETYVLEKFETEQMNFLKQILRAKIPIMVCQQFAKDTPFVDHFRLVIGYENDSITFNDPWYGQTMTISVREFIELWQTPGQKVPGGILKVVLRKA
jgi:predicted double-glycine peptidase